MANELDEITGPVKKEGRDINVIDKQIEVKTGAGSIVFEVFLWILFIIPGLVFLFMKIGARNYFRQLQQKIQRNASQVDNYIEQRVMILTNVAQLVNKAVDLDKDTMKSVAALRSGANPEAVASQSQDVIRNEKYGQLDNLFRNINVQIERYPDLKAHAEIMDAMQQNNHLQQEITAAREIYNDSILQWNTDIYRWPAKMIVAAKAGYTTRIPFSTSAEIKQQARQTFF